MEKRVTYAIVPITQRPHPFLLQGFHHSDMGSGNLFQCTHLFRIVVSLISFKFWTNLSRYATLLLLIDLDERGEDPLLRPEVELARSRG